MEDIINCTQTGSERNHRGSGQGKLFVVGIGPGNPLDRTRRAEQVIAACSLVVGYSPYVDSLVDLTSDQELCRSGMRQEPQRCRYALEQAAQGQKVALVSSGDAGIYGMAGLAMEIAAAEKIKIPIEVVPGVTAASASAARLGAPLMLDSATISLSDLLVPWEMIVRRLEATAAADLVVSLYNPRSKKRLQQLEQAAEIFLRHRPATTPVGIVTSAGQETETVVFSDLEHFLGEQIGMRSLVIIGNRTTRLIRGRMVTPRGYAL